jgi:hypothetical protein
MRKEPDRHRRSASAPSDRGESCFRGPDIADGQLVRDWKFIAGLSFRRGVHHQEKGMQGVQGAESPFRDVKMTSRPVVPDIDFINDLPIASRDEGLRH